MDISALPDEWFRGAQVDASAGAAFFVDPSGDKGFVSFDVPRTTVLKAKYAKEKRLGGLFYWTGSYDRTGSQSLVAAGYHELTMGRGLGLSAP